MRTHLVFLAFGHVGIKSIAPSHGVSLPCKNDSVFLLKADQRKGCPVKCPCGVVLSVPIISCLFF